MNLPTSRNRAASLLAGLTLALAAGCTDTNTSKDDRTGRGSGDQVPAQGGGSAGTNASTNEVTTEGPGSQIVGQPKNFPQGASAPYGGSGAGVAPPVTPAKGTPPSGDSNSGQMTGSQGNPGADASTEGAKPGGGATGPGTGKPPR